MVKHMTLEQQAEFVLNTLMNNPVVPNRDATKDEMGFEGYVNSDSAILAKVKGGSYAYCDSDSNYYCSGFGLSYQ